MIRPYFHSWNHSFMVDLGIVDSHLLFPAVAVIHRPSGMMGAPFGRL
jgi:hypothetical protein